MKGLLVFFLSVAISCAYAQGSSPDGEALAKQMLSNEIIPSVSSSSGSNTLSALGVSAKTVGSPSSDQINDMGIIGHEISKFTFLTKPSCQFSEQHIFGVNGSYLLIPCQKVKTGEVSATFCAANAKNTNSCLDKVLLNLPVSGKLVSVGNLRISVTCNASGHCVGSMKSNTKIVTGNSSDMVQKAQKLRKNDSAYQSVFNIYASKKGYSRTQAYMRSFQNNGSNQWLSKCVNGMSGYIKSGIYYSCDGNQQGDAYNSCKITKSCIKYNIDRKTISQNHQCILTASPKSIECSKTPVVQVTSKSLPKVQDNKSVTKNNPISSFPLYTVPTTIGGRNNLVGAYINQIQVSGSEYQTCGWAATMDLNVNGKNMIRVSKSTGGGGNIVTNFNNDYQTNISIKPGDEVSWSVWVNPVDKRYCNSHDSFKGTISLSIVVPAKVVKSAKVSQRTNC